jgi:hypothetical protein
LEHLVVENQIIIKGAKGKPKRSEKIKPNDIILPYNQLLFEVFKKKNGKMLLGQALSLEK